MCSSDLKGRKDIVSDVLYIGMTAIEFVNFRLLYIDADDVEARPGKFNGERQAYITKPQNANPRFFG